MLVQRRVLLGVGCHHDVHWHERVVYHVRCG